MTIVLSLLVCVIGVLVYALSANTKVQELGQIAYAFGLLVFLLQADKVVTLLGLK